MRAASRSRKEQVARNLAHSSGYSPAELGMDVTTGDVRPLLSILSGDTSLVGTALDWQDEAVCPEVDPSLFFLERGQSSTHARSVCAGCPVRRPCLTDALRRPGDVATGGYGIWGATSPEQREYLLGRFRGNVAAAADYAMRCDPLDASPDPQPREVAA